MGFTGFYWVLPGFIGFYWVLLGFTGFHSIVWGFHRYFTRFPVFNWTKRCLTRFLRAQTHFFTSRYGPRFFFRFGSNAQRVEAVDFEIVWKWRKKNATESEFVGPRSYKKKQKKITEQKKKCAGDGAVSNFFFGFFNYRFPIINRALDTEDFPSLLLLPEIKETKEKRHFHGVWYADRTAINCCCCCCCCCCCFVVPLPYPFFLFETSKQPLRFGGETIKQRLVAKNSVKAVKTR